MVVYLYVFYYTRLSRICDATPKALLIFFFYCLSFVYLFVYGRNNGVVLLDTFIRRLLDIKRLCQQGIEPITTLARRYKDSQADELPTELNRSLNRSLNHP